MKDRARVLVTLALTAAGAAAGATAPPKISCDAAGVCVASRLPPLLADRDVLGYVKSGLTTTLLLTLTTRGEGSRKQRAHARIELRFEPWEEFFDVRVAGSGPSQSLRVPSLAALETWWRDLGIRFANGAAARGAGTLEVDVIPFSEEEEADTRRWYAEALRPKVETNRSGNGPALAQVLDALTLTSIKRHGVLRYSWSTEVEAAR